MSISLLGTVAAVLTTISFVPQAWQIVRTKDVEGISLGMYILFTMGVYLWIIYGFLQKDWNLVGANTITGIFATIILTFRIKYGKK